MLCGPALLAGCYLLQLLFNEASGKYVTYCSTASFDIWMDFCRQMVCSIKKKPKWSGRNRKSGLRLTIQAHNIPFVTVWFLASFDHDEKKEEQIIMTWSFIHNPLFCWINKRIERLWVGKLLTHETGRPKLLKQAALVELASGCIKRDHVSHQATCTDPSARFRFTGWLRHSVTVGPVGGNALFISQGFHLSVATWQRLLGG